MNTTNFVSNLVRTTIPNTNKDCHICVIVKYEECNGGIPGPTEHIEITATPVISYNYVAAYDNKNSRIPNGGGYIEPISLFNMFKNNVILGVDKNSKYIDIDMSYVSQLDGTFWNQHDLFRTIEYFHDEIREKYRYSGRITGTPWIRSDSIDTSDSESEYEINPAMLLPTQNIMEILDKNSNIIPEGDYLKLCNELTKIRRI